MRVQLRESPYPPRRRPLPGSPRATRWIPEPMPCRPETPIFVSLLGLALCAVSIAGCRAGAPHETALLEDVTFREATARGDVELAPRALGPESRPALEPKRSPAHDLVAFVSDPIESDGALRIEGALAMQSRDRRVVETDRPLFRLRAVGPSGEKTLLERTGLTDFPPDRWSDYRIEFPDDLGSPVSLSFETSRPPLGRHESLRARALWTPPRVARRAKARRPDVLLVVFDTLRADHTQPYGYARETTPFLSQIAARGAVVRDFVASYPTTLTAHWSMFTGLLPAHHGVYPGGGINKPTATTLADRFHDAGYATAAFTEGGYVHSLFGFDRGFDRYDNGPATTLVDHSGSAPETFALAQRWLLAQQDVPWFVFLHTYQVHSPYAPPPEYREMFADEYRGRWQDEFPVLASFTVNEGRTRVGAEELAHVTRLYDAEIRELDDLFARFWKTLDAAGRFDDAIVIVTSDHGEDLMEHGWLQHGTTLYDPALRVPFLVVAPGRVAPGRTLDCQRPQTDLMPTVLELAGLVVPEGLDGRSLSGELARGRCEGDRPALSELVEPTYERHADLPLVSLRSSGWKLIRHVKSGRLERYHVERDPGEREPVEDATSTRALEAQLDAYVATRPVGLDDGVEEISPELRARLQALGYLP